MFHVLQVLYAKKVFRSIGMGVPKKQLDAAIAYIAANDQIRDCLISGGTAF